MLEFLKQKKNLIIIIGIIVLVGIYWIFNMSTDTQDINTQDNILKVAENTNDNNDEEDKEDMIVVHITGGINKPGIVKLKENSRIEDAIEAAGGLSEDSDITDVNLAYVLEDGVKIRIPTIDDKKNKNEEESYIIEDSGKNVILEDNSEGTSSSMVNINKANQTELETLPGIGPSLATRIIEYRESNGKFSKKEDIKNVTGIGDSKYANIQDLITVK